MLLAILLSSLLFFAAHSTETEVLSTRELSFENRDCAASETCSLTRFGISVVDSETAYEEARLLGASMRASYRTRTLEDLRDYAIVQWIRGCIFESELKDGEIRKVLPLSRRHLGQPAMLKHPDWAVDSESNDPVYWSYPQERPNRHYYYRWNKAAGSWDENTAVLFGQRRPADPELYVTDHPSRASLRLTAPDRPTSVSLRFRTCIYRTRDLPTRVKVPGTQPIPGAIHCFEWASSHVYDHARQRFESPEEIDPFCLQ